jgi:hypothetical protein
MARNFSLFSWRSRLASPAVPSVPAVPSKRPTKLVPTPIGDANILTAIKSTLNWLNDNTDSVPTSEEIVDILTKFRDGKMASTSKTFRAPSPSDPWSSDEFDSETGEAKPRRGNTAPPMPPPRPPRRPRFTADSVPSFTGKADAHLPQQYRGLPYKFLPKEMQEHPLSWRILEQEAIWDAKAEALLVEAEENGRYYRDTSEMRYEEMQKQKAANRAKKDAARVAEEVRYNEKRAAQAARAAKIAAENRAGESSRAANITDGVAQNAAQENTAASFATPAQTSKIANVATQRSAQENTAASVTTPARTSKSPKTPPVIPAEWAGLEINPKTRLPYGTYGLFYGINYSESDDSSEEEELARLKKAEQERERNLQKDNLAQSRHSHRPYAAMQPRVSPIAEETVNVTAVVDSIPCREFEALKGILRPSAPNRLNNNAKVHTIDKSIDSTNKIDNVIDLTNEIDNNTTNTSNTEVSPQIEIIPRAPRTPRPIAEPRPHQTPAIKKLFDRKLFSASQPTAGLKKSVSFADESGPIPAPAVVSSLISLQFPSLLSASQPAAGFKRSVSFADESGPIPALAAVSPLTSLQAPSSLGASQPTVSPIKGPVPALDAVSSTSPFQITPETQSIVDAIPVDALSSPPPFRITLETQSIVDAIPDEEFKLLENYMLHEFDFDIPDEIMTLVDAIPDEEFDEMALDATNEM